MVWDLVGVGGSVGGLMSLVFRKKKMRIGVNGR